MCVPVPGGIRQPGISCQGVIRPTPLILGALVGLSYLRFPERIVRISGRGYALRRDEIIANCFENECRNKENGCAGPRWVTGDSVKSASDKLSYCAYSTIKPLIRARLVVQVHPGPPFKSPVNTRRFSLFRSPSKNRFVNRLSTSRLAGWHYTQGVKTLRVKPERIASIRLCRERCPVTSKDVEGSARHCTTVQGAGSHF